MNQRSVNDELARRLQSGARERWREPPAGFRSRLMANLENRSGEATRLAPLGVPWRRLTAAAALIAVMAVVAMRFLPTAGREQTSPAAQPFASAHSDDELTGPALVQPLRDAFAIAIDLESPLEAEANRMLADAAQAGRMILNRLPFRGSAVEFTE